MTTVSVHEAKTQLSRLIQQSLEGEEIVIARGNEPVVRLTPLKQKRKTRRLGGARGLIRRMDKDFDKPVEDFGEYMP